MYEGKNIHYSPLDNKPLCSYSGKLCKQRRLNGYALCLRHVLEDPAAPFRQCTYTARNKQQCTNPIHQSNASVFCTSHMQLVGLLPMASKTAGKIARNGQHPVESHAKDSSAVLDTCTGQLRLTNGPYIFKKSETGCRTDSSSSSNNARLGEVRSIPMARLYPELAEKLEKQETLGIKLMQQCGSKSQLKTSLTIVGGNIQTVYNHNSLSNKNQLPVSNDCNKMDKLLSTLVSANNTVSDRSRVISSTMINSSASLQQALDTSMNGTTCIVSTPVLGLPQWPLPANGQASVSMPTPQLLTEALRGLLSTTPTSTNFAQQQSILQSLFPNLLSYVSSGVSCNGSPLIQSEASKSLGKNCKSASSVVISAAPIATTLIESSKSTCSLATNSCAASNDCGIELRHGLSKVQVNAPCLVRPKRLCKSSLEHQVRRKIGRHSAMKIFSDQFARLEYNHDILPFGVDSSEEDSELDPELPRQRHWSALSSDDEERDTDLADEVAFNIRQTKLQLQKSKERRQFLQLQMRHRGNACLRRRQAAADLALIEAARHCPGAAADAINATQLLCRGSKFVSQPHPRKCETQSKRRYCLYTNDDDVACGDISLPYTNHCLKHIMYNVDQQLFGYCTAKFSDGTQCCEPVFDMKHELPLCHAHSAKMDIHQNTCVEPISKKQRKKTKPSALTRPPKKGKKKRPRPPKKCGFSRTLSDVNSCVSTIADTGAERAVTISAGTFSMPAEPVPACAVITPTCISRNLHAMAPRMELANDPLEEDSLDMVEQLSPGAIERSLEMPMDADQATKFLDEHDLHDVFNKMSDEAFDLLTGKNGEYGISKDDDEALVRVLAEVSKPFDNNTLDARLGHSGDQPTSRNSDGTCSMPDDELMKHITSVLFSRNPLSPSLEDFSDSIGDVNGENSSSDMLCITQMLSASSSQLNDSESLGSPITDRSSMDISKTKLGMLASSIQPTKNGVAFQTATNTRDILPTFVNAGAFPFTTIGTVSSSVAVATEQMAAAAARTVSRQNLVVPNVISSACVNRSFANVSQSFHSGQSRAAATISSICPHPPVLHIGSLPGLRQFLKVNNASLPTTSASAKPPICLSTTSTCPLQTLTNTSAPMKQSWFVINQRPLQSTVASSISALPLSGIFPPFAATFCSLPPAVSSLTPVLKMSHPLADAAAMSSYSMPTNSVSLTLGSSISLLAPASSLLLSSSSKNSVLPSNVVRLATSTGQSGFLPTVTTRPTVDQNSLSNS